MCSDLFYKVQIAQRLTVDLIPKDDFITHTTYLVRKPSDVGNLRKA